MRHGLYGIFWTEEHTMLHPSGAISNREVAMFALATNKRKALRAGRKYRGTVSRMDWPSGSGAWDAPTFKACSDVIADYR